MMSWACRLALAFAILCGITMPGSAETRDRFVGDWAKDCEPGLQCWAEISRSKRNGPYLFRFFAAARNDAKDVVCRRAATLKPSGQGLVAGSAKRPIRIDPGPEGGILVRGIGRCRAIVIDGDYDALGDI